MGGREIAAWEASEGTPESHPEVVTLLAIDSCSGGFYVTRAGLDFDEAEYVFVPRDEIDFSVVAWGAEIACDHDIALTPQLEVGCFLATAAGTLVRGFFGTLAD